MSTLHNDINDDEIRIISSDGNGEGQRRKRHPRRRRHWIYLLTAAVAAMAIIVLLFVLADTAGEEDEDEIEIVTEQPLASLDEGNETVSQRDTIKAQAAPYVEISDTIVGGKKFTILTPVNATARLELSSQALRDSSAVMVVQAADIRRDNGEIVGAYVYRGELLSRGQSKTGFCAISSGMITIGVADATPYLEQAIENEGYFFRQYPLVVGGQVVSNKLKSSSTRKALALLNGRVVVILSHKRMTLNDFAASLAELGVTNAICLVGSSAFGFAKEKNGFVMEFGTEQSHPEAMINYIVWE